MKLLAEDTAQYNIFSFSTATLNDILSHFSKIDFKKVFIGYLVMVSTKYFQWVFTGRLGLERN